MLKGKSVLVLEEEFLIAMEIERILNAQNAKVHLAHNQDDLMGLRTRWSEFDVLVTEVNSTSADTFALAETMRGAGVAVVFATGDATYRDGVPGFEGAPVVIKPYTDHDLAEACNIAISRCGERDGEPAS